MRQDIHDYFRIGTLQWMSFPNLAQCDAVERICSDDFFDVVEIAPTDVSDRAAIRDMLASSQTAVCCGVHPAILAKGLNPNAIDEAERERAERVLLDAVDEAATLGAEGIAFLAGRWEPENRDAAVNQLVTTTLRVCRYAALKGLFVELEVFDYDVDKSTLIGPASLAAAFAARVCDQVDNFGLIVDLSHIPLTHESIDNAVSTMAKYTTHFHIGNAVAQKGCENYGDQHPRFGFPNSENGEKELTAFLQALKMCGFVKEGSRTILSFEVKPFGGEDSALVLAGCKRTLRRAWAALDGAPDTHEPPMRQFSAS
mgnify:CR=1 FL=1